MNPIHSDGLLKVLHCSDGMANRVAGGFSPPAPTTPCMRDRTGRFEMLPGRSRVMHVHPQVLDGNHALFFQPLIRHATLRCIGL